MTEEMKTAADLVAEGWRLKRGTLTAGKPSEQVWEKDGQTITLTVGPKEK